MHPRRGHPRAGTRRFPRRRGDAPEAPAARDMSGLFPPQARGCTVGICETVAYRDVSPAGAGMHLIRFVPGSFLDGFPRRRGDAPSASAAGDQVIAFPPQARGCTWREGRDRGGAEVSPAGAGMHRSATPTRAARPSFPRRRGDAPPPRAAGHPARRFPPQARGCTEVPGLGDQVGRVSPAGAGMHPRRASSVAVVMGFPRRRGDAPDLAIGVYFSGRFPPQARGCTRDHSRRPAHDGVSPAGAGMHRHRVHGLSSRPGFPRRRGDAPLPGPGCPHDPAFPPQARGCTLSPSRSISGCLVSPAGAGMHPGLERPPRPGQCFPRRRGDAPPISQRLKCGFRFPPQARGCTLGCSSEALCRRVSPAGAGMHPSPTTCPGWPAGFPRRRGDAPDEDRDQRRAGGFPPQARGCTLRHRTGDRGRGVSPAGAGMHPR